MNEKLIQKVLYNYLTVNKKGKWFVCNTKSLGWEADFISISKNRMVYEYEIKISKADFNKDKDKKLKHKLILDKIYPVNYFNYVVPEGMVKPKDVHPLYGLIYIIEKEYDERYYSTVRKGNKVYDVKIIKKPKKLNKDQISYELLVKALTTVMNAFYKNFLN